MAALWVLTLLLAAAGMFHGAAAANFCECMDWQGRSGRAQWLVYR
jgi:hypothetical protein